MGLHILNFLECIHPCVMCMNIEIASIIFEICVVPEPATTSGTGLLLDRDTGTVTEIICMMSLGCVFPNDTGMLRNVRDG